MLPCIHRDGPQVLATKCHKGSQRNVNIALNNQYFLNNKKQVILVKQTFLPLVHRLVQHQLFLDLKTQILFLLPRRRLETTFSWHLGHS